MTPPIHLPSGSTRKATQSVGFKRCNSVMQMKRRDYLNTFEGQVRLRRKRQMNRLQFVFNGQEPKSKNAISEEEKEAFQNTILTKMKEQQRRYFKASVALQFDFFPHKNNPPALHTMPKNYLDLLAKPVAGVTSTRKRLVFEDDRQVRYLAVKYHIQSNATEPSIWLKAAPFRDFVSDIALLKKIKDNELRSCSDGFFNRKSSLSWDELIGDDEDTHNNEAIDLLREHERNKQSWVSHYGQDVYEA